MQSGGAHTEKEDRGAGIARRRGGMCLYKKPSVRPLLGLLLKTLPFVRIQFGLPQ